MPNTENIFEWDVALWRNELKVSVLPTIARGVYRELLDVMHLSDHSGVITGTREEIARLGRCSVVELDQTLHELKKHHTCNVTERDNQVTLTNRKMRREWNERENTRKRVEKHRDSGLKRHCNGNVTPSYKNDKDDKALSSLSLKTLKPEVECKGGDGISEIPSPNSDSVKRQGNADVTPPRNAGGASVPASRPRKPLTPAQRAIAHRFEIVLGHQWVNDAGKWVNRCKANPDKAERVVAEVESALKENRILETPAQYAEQIWKEFN